MAVYLPLFDESPVAKLQDPIFLCEKSLSGRSQDGRTIHLTGLSTNLTVYNACPSNAKLNHNAYTSRPL